MPGMSQKKNQLFGKKVHYRTPLSNLNILGGVSKMRQGMLHHGSKNLWNMYAKNIPRRSKGRFPQYCLLDNCHLEFIFALNAKHQNLKKIFFSFLVQQGVLRDCLQSQLKLSWTSQCYQLVLRSTNFGTFQKILILWFLSKRRKSKKWTFSKINNVNSSSIFA